MNIFSLKWNLDFSIEDPSNNSTKKRQSLESKTKLWVINLMTTDDTWWWSNNKWWWTNTGLGNRDEVVNIEFKDELWWLPPDALQDLILLWKLTAAESTLSNKTQQERHNLLNFNELKGYDILKELIILHQSELKEFEVTINSPNKTKNTFLKYQPTIDKIKKILDFKNREITFSGSSDSDFKNIPKSDSNGSIDMILVITNQVKEKAFILNLVRETN